jgi:hypothetical protein
MKPIVSLSSAQTNGLSQQIYTNPVASRHLLVLLLTYLKSFTTLIPVLIETRNTPQAVNSAIARA